MDVAQAVVTGVAAAALELDLTGGDVELVMDDQNFFGLNLEEARERGHRFTGGIHEGLRLQQPHGVAVDVGAGHQAVVAALGNERYLEFACEFVDPPESGVVSRCFVFGAGVAEANKQFDHGGDYPGNE